MRHHRTSLTLGLALAGVAATSCVNYLLPVWNGSDSKVAARERDSIKQCGTGALTADGAKMVTRQPYIQSTTTTSTIVAWGSAEEEAAVVLREPGADGKVIKTSPAVYAASPGRARQRLAAQQRAGRELAADDIYVVKAEFKGLEPGHLYCYQLTHFDGRPLTEPAPLVTAPPRTSTDPVHFIAFGDSGTGGAAQAEVARRMSAEPFDLMILLGDIAYSAGRPAELQNNFFSVYRDYLKFVPAFPSIGNHERLTRSGGPYFEAFVLPQPERYYSFDWGPIHFVAIDTTFRDSAQLVWLEQDLRRTQQRWKIVFGHHAMYTNALRGAQLPVRQAFANILTRNKVDLVLTGHEHNYERFRIADVNYVVSGGGGGQLHRFGGTSEALKQATVHHFLAFEVTPTKLVMRAIDIAGNEIEKVQLDKAAAKEDAKVKVDDKPDETQNPVAPEKSIVPDEKLHDTPDDDTKQPKAKPDEPAPKPDKTKDKKKKDQPPAGPVATKQP